MVVNQEIINDYKNHGVALLHNAVSTNWLEKLAKGIEKNFQNPSQYKCVYEKKMIKKFFMMITVIGKELMNMKNFFLILVLQK